jgi:hypothetical protein
MVSLMLCNSISCWNLFPLLEQMNPSNLMSAILFSERRFLLILISCPLRFILRESITLILCFEIIILNFYNSYEDSIWVLR